MVLAELGGAIKGALSKLNNATVIDEEALDAVLKEICTALMHSDVNIRVVQTIRKNIKGAINLEELAAGTNKRRLIQQAVFNELVKILSCERKPYELKKGRPNVIMFVGLQGSGKTTTCTKYAHFYKKKQWKTCLVCADTFRAGAFDQLKQNAMKIKVPFYGSYTETDPVKIAADGVEKFIEERYEVIIVDTSGRHKQQASLFEEMQQVAEATEPDEIIFVMDSSIGQAVAEQASAFRMSVDVGSVIVTKMDGHAKGGGALSAVAATGAPIVSLGTGEHFDDFERFEVKGFVSRLLGMGDIMGLMKTMTEAGLDKQGPELLQRMTQGVFTLRDMYEQFSNIMKMGSLTSIMSMIPGLSENLIPKGKEKEGQARLKSFCCMMDSMTDEELDTNKGLEPSRIPRIARGSGTTIKEVEQLMVEHKRFAKMIGKMGKMGGKGGKGLDMAQMQRNPQAMLKNLQGAMDPRMMQQMGGQQGMMNMMKQMGNMDMGALMSQMGGGGGGMPGGMDPAAMEKMMKQMGGGGMGGLAGLMGGGKGRGRRR